MEAMEETTLSRLLEEDREMVMETMAKDRTPEAVRTVLEKELDRIHYRYAQQCGSEREAAMAGAVLHAIKNDLSLMEAVGEVREWKRTSPDRAGGKKLRPLSVILAAAGLVLVLCSLFVLLRDHGAGLSFSVLLPPLAGAALLFLGGLLLWKKTGSEPETGETKREFLIDPAGVYHTLQGTLLAADKSLQDAREAEKAEREQTQALTDTLSGEEAELFALLLEAAYTRRGTDGEAEEIISEIRYYLHRQNVEIVDYTRDRESWFELLPARRSGTLRPALTGGGRLLKKGLASAAED